jgi:rubredoxin
MILATGKCNLSPLSTDAPFSLFQRFGMQSGRAVDKFADFTDVARSENGLYYLTKYSTAFLSLNIVESHDLGSHTLFIGELVDGEVLRKAENCTYGYYQTVIKANAPKPEAKSGWRCKICNHVYEGENLPEDYVCPICKHRAEDFEKIKETFVGYYTSEETTKQTIRATFENENYLIDTHTAVAKNAAEQYKSAYKAERKMLTVSTASPYKFAKDVLNALDPTDTSDGTASLNALSEKTATAFPMRRWNWLPMKANIRKSRSFPPLISQVTLSTKELPASI